MLPVVKAANANAVLSARWQAGGPFTAQAKRKGASLS
jgi:hypothetical protein